MWVQDTVSHLHTLTNCQFFCHIIHFDVGCICSFFSLCSISFSISRFRIPDCLIYNVMILLLREYDSLYYAGEPSTIFTMLLGVACLRLEHISDLLNHV